LSKVKFQHYVPRFYLKQFCFRTTKSSGYTHCYDKFDAEIRINNINRVAGQNYFFDDSGSHVQAIESGLRKIESKFGPSYKKLHKFEDLNMLSSYEKIIISLYIATQEIRTLELRENLRIGLMQLRETLEGRGVSLTSAQLAEFEEALTEGSLRGQHREMLKEIPEFATILVQMKWMLIKNRFDVPFWTSDNPVVRWNDEDHGIYGNLGYLSTGIQILYVFSSGSILGSGSHPGSWIDRGLAASTTPAQSSPSHRYRYPSRS